MNQVWIFLEAEVFFCKDKKKLGEKKKAKPVKTFRFVQTQNLHLGVTTVLKIQKKIFKKNGLDRPNSREREFNKEG